MFVLLLLLDVLLDLLASSSLGIARVQNLNDHIGRVDDLVELVPDAFALAGLEQREHGLVGHALVVHDEIRVLRGVVLVRSFGCLFGKVLFTMISCQLC